MRRGLLARFGFLRLLLSPPDLSWIPLLPTPLVLSWCFSDYLVLERYNFSLKPIFFFFAQLTDNSKIGIGVNISCHFFDQTIPWKQDPFFFLNFLCVISYCLVFHVWYNVTTWSVDIKYITEHKSTDLGGRPEDLFWLCFLNLLFMSTA